MLRAAAEIGVSQARGYLKITIDSIDYPSEYLLQADPAPLAKLQLLEGKLQKIG